MRAEDPAVYGAVVVLRAVGCRVYRSGALHRVDGALLTTRELLVRVGAIRTRGE